MQSDATSIQNAKRHAIRRNLISYGDSRHKGQRAPRRNSKSAKVSSPRPLNSGGEYGARSVKVDGFCVNNDIAFIGQQTDKQHSDKLEDYEISDSSNLSGEWLW